MVLDLLGSSLQASAPPFTPAAAWLPSVAPEPLVVTPAALADAIERRLPAGQTPDSRMLHALALYLSQQPDYSCTTAVALEHLRQEFGYSGGRLWGLIASRPDAFELLKAVACRYRLRAAALLQPALRPPEEEAAEEARRQLVLETTIQKALAAPRSPNAAAAGHNRAIAAAPPSPALLAAIERLLPAEPS